MRRMNITGLLLLLTLIPFYIPELSAQTYAIAERKTLRGLKGFSVLIEEPTDEITQAGLTKSILKTDVELKLRKAGIQILTRDEMHLTPGRPRLYVNVNALILPLNKSRSFIYSVSVEFTQDVILFRNRSIKIHTKTWEQNTLGINPDLRHVREVVGDLVDQFMNDYLAVNPK